MKPIYSIILSIFSSPLRANQPSLNAAYDKVINHAYSAVELKV